MNVFVYGLQIEEESYFTLYSEQNHMRIASTNQRATVETAYMAKGFTCISVLSTPLCKETIEALYQVGVRFISTRTVGYDHIDIEACKALGIHVSNINYSPESVADYTIMLLLMTLRKMKLIMKSAELQDYSFPMMQGRNLKDRIVGVIGVGSIGATFIEHLKGFGCRILAYTPHPQRYQGSGIEFVELDDVYVQSDIISLHVPLNEHTHHMINHESLSKMKQGVILINTARGGLIDNDALIAYIESGHVAGVALDVVEGETGIYYNNRKGYITKQRQMSILQAFPNVIMSPHMAFLTEESTQDMVYNSIYSCVLYAQDKEDLYRIC